MTRDIWVGVSPSLPKLTQYIQFVKSGQKIWAGPPPSLRQNPKEQLLFFGRSSLISKQCFEFTKLPAPYQQQWHHCCSVPILLRLVMMTCWIDKAKKTRAWNSWSLSFQEGEEKNIWHHFCCCLEKALICYIHFNWFDGILTMANWNKCPYIT